MRFEQAHYYASLFDDKKGDYSKEYEYINPVAALYPKKELTEEEKLNYINTLLVAGAERTGKTEAPAEEDKDPLTAKERSLQNKVDMLYRQNDLLMNEIDKQCGYDFVLDTKLAFFQNLKA